VISAFTCNAFSSVVVAKSSNSVETKPAAFTASYTSPAFAETLAVLVTSFEISVG
jgi:hypothetical protein